MIYPIIPRELSELFLRFFIKAPLAASIICAGIIAAVFISAAVLAKQCSSEDCDTEENDGGNT